MNFTTPESGPQDEDGAAQRADAFDVFLDAAFAELDNLPDDDTDVPADIQRDDPPTPSASNEPVTKYGLPNFGSIVPGQSDSDLAIILAAMKNTLKRGTPAVAAMYAGHLGKTAPSQEDSADGSDHRARYDAWRSACTELQRKLLDNASEAAREKRRAMERAEYAAEQGRPVREYKRALSEEDKVERRAAQMREKQRAYRERQRLKKLTKTEN